MKRQNLFWITVTILIVATLLGLGSLAAREVAVESPSPVYSLSPGTVGMISGPGYVSDGATFELPEKAVAEAVQGYLDRQDNPDLAVVRQLEFNSAYQIEVIEQSSGRYAFGLMVSKDSGEVSPKAGPNILWNTKYGAEVAQIGGGYGMVGRLVSHTSPSEMSLAESEARRLAATSVREMDDGLKLDGGAKHYYGFYQFDVIKGGEPVGELAVNGYSSQVWYEQWGEPRTS